MLKGMTGKEIYIPNDGMEIGFPKDRTITRYSLFLCAET
jgi:hypothetical protein